MSLDKRQADNRSAEEQTHLQDQIKNLVRSERRLYETKAVLDRQAVQINALVDFGVSIIEIESIDELLKEAVHFLEKNFAFKKIVAAQVDLVTKHLNALIITQDERQFKTVSIALEDDLSSQQLINKSIFYVSIFHQELKSKTDGLAQKLFTATSHQGYEIATGDAILLISSFVSKSNQSFILLLDSPPPEMVSENERLPLKKDDFFLRLFARHLEGSIENRVYQKQLEQFNIQLEKKVKERTHDLEVMSERFQNIFNNSPISIWELDCSAFSNDFSGGIDDQIQEFSRTDSDKSLYSLSDFFNKIRIVNVNKSSFVLFDTKSQEEMQEMFFRIIRAAGKKQIINVFHSLVAKKGECAFQISVKTKKQKNITLNIGFSFESSDPEIGLSRVLMSLFDVTELIMAKAKASFLAEHDPLTGLYSRNLLYPFLSNALNRQSRSKTHMALFCLDLDKFKYINDSYGHDIGDILLQQFAKRLLKTCRADDLIIRIGGDEFAIIVHDLTSPANAAMIANNILQSFEKPFTILRARHHVTISIGIVFLPRSAKSVFSKDMLKMADIALFNAKDRGRNMFCFFDEEMNERYQRSIIIERELNGVLKRKELLLYYQPIIALTTGDLLGYEALLRWNFQKREILTPDKFLSSLQRFGLIVEVGQWIIKQACSDFLIMKKAGLFNASESLISVNISTAQLSNDSFVEDVIKIVNKSKVPFENIVFEISESAVINEIDLISPILKKIGKNKIKIAIDDFGSGYSSLPHLASLSFDFIKIDQSFLKSAPSKKKIMMILNTVLSIAENTGSRVIMEGVESNTQLNIVKHGAADLAQGYYFDKPKPLDEILRLHKTLRKNKLDS